MQMEVVLHVLLIVKSAMMILHAKDALLGIYYSWLNKVILQKIMFMEKLVLLALIDAKLVQYKLISVSAVTKGSDLKEQHASVQELSKEQ